MNALDGPGATVTAVAADAVTLADGRKLSRRKGQDKDAPAAIILPAGHNGPAFIAYPNFKVVLAYNNAISYALAICQLASSPDSPAVLVTRWVWNGRNLQPHRNGTAG